MAARSALTDPFDLTRVTGDDSSAEQDLSTYIADPQLRVVGLPRVTVKVRLDKNK
jgi:hypothetical protein